MDLHRYLILTNCTVHIGASKLNACLAVAPVYLSASKAYQFE